MARKSYTISLCWVFAGLSLITMTGALGRSPASLLSGSPILEAAPTLAPFQHVRFCLHYPEDCKSDPSESSKIELGTEVLEQLNRVNQEVNAAILPQAKNNGTGLQGAGWTIAPVAGDCNDYAVTKRHELLRSGLPANALRLAVVKTASGVGHLVLVVVTIKGDLVLDNLTEAIRPWQNTDYQWLKIQSASDAHYWYDVKTPAVALSQLDRKVRVAGR